MTIGASLAGAQVFADAGSWFVVPDPLTGVADLEQDSSCHRWIVAEARYEEPSLPAYIRSTSRIRRGLPHARHESGHWAGCKIDRPGRIAGREFGRDTAPYIPYPLATRSLTFQRYSCLEPKAWIIAEVRRMLADYRGYRPADPSPQ